MNWQTVIEIIGYAGSLLVIVSMLMTSVIKLRVINTVGSLIFATYALIIHSYPTAIMQVCLITINVVSLYNLTKNKKDYSVIKVDKNDSYLKYFQEIHREDILKFFPDADRISAENVEVYFVCCGSNPAGLFCATRISDSELTILIDYATPFYRDCSVGKHLYKYLAEMGIKKLSAKNDVLEHAAYLKKMGFKLQGGVYEKEFKN
jgi:hypothetical protein